MKRVLIGSLAVLSVLMVSAIASCTPAEPTPPQTAVPSSSEKIATQDPAPDSNTVEETSISQQNSQLTVTGTFVAGEHPTTGTVRIVEENGQQYVELGEDFQTDSGPDLVVILHQSNDVIGGSAPPAYGIEEGSYVTLAPLQAVNGIQRYGIPATVELADYGSVAIWCRQFNATFGAASLTRS